MLPKSSCFSTKAHLASFTTPWHLTSTLLPSSIWSTRSSSSLLYPVGLKVTWTLFEDPAATSSKAGSGTKAPLLGICHLYLALALPWLLMTSCSVTLMSMFSSENSNLNTFFETSRTTGSAWAYTRKLKGLSLM